MWDCVCLSNIVNTSWLEAALLFAYFLWYLKEKSSSWCLWGDDRRQRATKPEPGCCKAPWEQEGCSCERASQRGVARSSMCAETADTERETIWSHHTLLQSGPQRTQTRFLSVLWLALKPLEHCTFYTAFFVTVAVINSSIQGGDKVSCAIKPDMLLFATLQTWLLNCFLMILFLPDFQ